MKSSVIVFVLTAFASSAFGLVACAQEVIIIEQPNVLPPTIEQPIIEQPVVDQPIIEHQIIDQIIEEAMLEQPVVVEGQQQTVLPGPYVRPVPRNPYYFGMNVVLKRDRRGRTTLMVVGVTQGSPAQNAGLEYGDEIRTVNGRGFESAVDSYDAVRLVNQYVGYPVHFGGPAPAAAMRTHPVRNQAAHMVVRNVRNGRDVTVTVYPTPVAQVYPLPTDPVAMAVEGK